MNISVTRGAKVGMSFSEYVDYLDKERLVPPDNKEWLEHIRGKGNDATHEIASMSRADAEELITFLEMLLKFIYEFPESLKRKTAGA
jgi:hypothetical protein